jgi:DNA-binding MarR family transcriptional regulator
MTVEQQTDETALDFLLALHRLVRSLRRSAESPSLHPTQLLVLVHLAEVGPARIGELAARVSCSQPTATTVTNGLEAAGLVRRIPDTSDGRAIRVQLTDAGRATLLAIAKDHAGQLRRRLDELDESDRQLVLAAVPVLRRMTADLNAAATGSAGRSRTSDS